MHEQEFHRLTLRIDALIHQASGKCEPAGSGTLKTSFKEYCQAAREVLQNKFLSGAADRCLQRYFSYQLCLINDLGFRLESCRNVLIVSGRESCTLLELIDAYSLELVGLTDYILKYFCPGFDPNRTAYPAYTRSFISGLNTSISALQGLLKNTLIAQSLRDNLNMLVFHMQGAGTLQQLDYRALAYFDYLLGALSPVAILPPAEQEVFLVRQLISCNFNHLGFLSYLQGQIRRELKGLSDTRKIENLKDHLSAHHFPPNPGTLVYDVQWPALSSMMSHWLKEEIAQICHARSALQQDLSDNPAEKLFLNTSVAHLACFIKAFYGQDLPGIPLSELFRWVAAHCRTKRQTNISPGSLNKEFYTISQFTAARVRDQLLKMVAGISAHYFPVMAAISAAYYGISIIQ